MTTTREERIANEIAKQKSLRQLADMQFSYGTLLQLFGTGYMRRLGTTRQHELIGKNYFSNHFHAGHRNPAGSKLLRRFIRANGVGSARTKRDYKALTGRAYNHMNLYNGGEA